MEKVILAHDLGTTGNKASLYDLSGNLIESYYHSYETYYPNQGWVEQNPEDLWEAFINSTKKVIETTGINPSKIIGISFSAHMMAAIPVDKEGNVLQDKIILWADHRSDKEAELIKEKIGWKQFYNRTGSGMELPLYPIAKILWIKNNQPEIYKRTYKFLGTKDFLINRLTGKFATDYSDASNTGMLDIRNRKWASDMLNTINIDIDKLPEEIYPSATVVGKINKKISNETGLKQGTPIVFGGGDVSCAALGAGVVKEGSIYNYIGSASWLAVASKTPIIHEKMRPFTLCHVVPDMNVVQLATFSAGVVYEWVKDEICWLEKSCGERFERDPYEIIDSEAEKSIPGANGLIFLPDLRPGGAPHNNLNDHGTLLGLSLSNERKDIIRSVLEGITFNIRSMYDALEKHGEMSFSDLKMIGGGSRSPLWRKIEASILNKNVSILSAQQEANSLGATIIAGVALDVFDSFEKATREFIKINETISANKQWHEIYEKKYKLFNRVYKKLMDINEEINRLNAELDDK